MYCCHQHDTTYLESLANIVYILRPIVELMKALNLKVTVSRLYDRQPII
jgi:hypothetical protein